MRDYVEIRAIGTEGEIVLGRFLLQTTYRVEVSRTPERKGSPPVPPEERNPLVPVRT